MITLTVVACQSEGLQNEAQLPTMMVLNSPTPPSTATPTADNRAVPSETPTNTIMPETSETPDTTPTLDAEGTVTAQAIINATATIITDTPNAPTSTPFVFNLEPSPTPFVLPETFVFGQSVEGRDLVAYTHGQGPLLILLVGGIHGGFESNTVQLIEEMHIHFGITPADLLPGVTIVLVPSLNPDGLTLGRVLDGRFNANRVDLNRNWGCGWQPTAFFREMEVDPGSAPFSEPETLALAAVINDLRPAVALFYHSAADAIYAGDCDGDGSSDEMAQVLGGATGYGFGVDFAAYPVSGTAPAWVDSLGIPSADVELASPNVTELDRNLRGVLALQCWLLEENAVNFPRCNDVTTIEG